MYEYDEEPETIVWNREKDYQFTFWVNDYVDYNVHYDIILFNDGSRVCERVGEYITILNDQGDIIESLEVSSLPEKYRKEAHRMAEDYEF